MFSYITSLFGADLGAIIANLNSTNIAESDYAVRQLVKYEDKRVKKEIIEKGAIVRLVELLYQTETSDATKENIANILANLALCNKESRREIAERGGITPLVGLLSTGTPTAQKFAVVALMNILVEDENVAVCDESVVEALIVLLRHDDEEVVRYAAGALANMATDKEKRVQIVQRRAVSPLMDLLKSDNIHSKGQAAGALMNIVEGDDIVKLQIAKLGAVANLVSLLEHGTTAGKVRAISLLVDLWQLRGEEKEIEREMSQPHVMELVEEVVTNGEKVESSCAETLLYLLRAPVRPSTFFPSSSSSSSSPSVPPPSSSPRPLPSHDESSSSSHDAPVSSSPVPSSSPSSSHPPAPSSPATPLVSPSYPTTPTPAYTSPVSSSPSPSRLSFDTPPLSTSPDPTQPSPASLDSTIPSVSSIRSSSDSERAVYDAPIAGENGEDEDGLEQDYATISLSDPASPTESANV